jgi:membrane protease YdiL (CAAX protease family)
MNSEPGRWPSLGRAFLFVVSCAVVLAVAASATRNIAQPWSSLVIGTVAGMGAFALTLLFVRWEGIRLVAVGAKPGRRSLPRFAFGFLVGLVLAALHALVVGASGHVRWIRGQEAGFAAMTISLIAYIALSCREELSFRGYPLRRLEGPYGVWGAQLIVALLFAVEHMVGGISWWHALLGSGVGSILFGMAAISTRGLAVPIGLHAAWNFGQWVLGEKDSTGIWKMVTQAGFQERVDLGVTIGYVVVMGCATLGFWWWHRAGYSNKDRISHAALPG